MIDIHAHILPGLDDGSPSMEESLELAALAVEGGVHTLVATPHSNQRRRFENYFTDELIRNFVAFREALKQEEIPLTVLAGMEIYASQDLKEKILDGRLIGLNGTDYYLIEFPFDSDPGYIEDCLEDVLEIGKTPVIAHPERYFCAQEIPSLVEWWRHQGCLLQVNRGSLFGRFGRHAKRLADYMMETDQVTCIASDAHSPYARTTFMGDIKEYLEDRYDQETAKLLLSTNPEKIVRGEPII